MASLFGEKNNGAKAQLVATGKVAHSTVNEIALNTKLIEKLIKFILVWTVLYSRIFSLNLLSVS